MAYSSTKFQATHLIQDAWYRMGQLQTWVITGGTPTTLINTAWAGVEEQIFEDDDPALIYGSIVVIKDTGGLAPEGEIARITDYDSGTQTLTFDAVSTSLAVGDKVGIASPLFPYEDVLQLANVAFRKLGKLELIDTSLTVVAGQSEYTLPFKVKPKRVRYQTIQDSDNNKWKKVQGWDYIPATAGVSPTLVIPDLYQGYKLELMYEDFHPELTIFSSDIHETLYPELATCALLAECYQWYNNKLGGSNEYWKQRENKAIQDLESAKALNIVEKEQKQIQGLPHWDGRERYVPGTSDLRY